MNDHSFFFYFWLFFMVVTLSNVFDRRRSPAKKTWIELPQRKFWSIVAREEQSLVVLTTRGFLRKQVCYLYPHQGLFFVTSTRPEELPKGTTLITIEEGLDR